MFLPIPCLTTNKYEGIYVQHTYPPSQHLDRSKYYYYILLSIHIFHRSHLHYTRFRLLLLIVMTVTLVFSGKHRECAIHLIYKGLKAQFYPYKLNLKVTKCKSIVTANISHEKVW